MSDKGFFASLIDRGTHANRPSPEIEGRLYYEDDTSILYRDSSVSWEVMNTFSGAMDYILIQDQKSQNTAGGTFTSGAWRTRDLNTEVSDDGGHASVASNQITLAAGTYICKISAPAVYVSSHQAILYNVTDDTTTLTGTSETSSQTSNWFQTRSFIQGKFTITSPKVFEVRHRCATTYATSGMGGACNFTTEVYTVAEFWFVR